MSNGVIVPEPGKRYNFDNFSLHFSIKACYTHKTADFVVRIGDQDNATADGFQCGNAELFKRVVMLEYGVEIDPSKLVETRDHVLRTMQADSEKDEF